MVSSLQALELSSPSVHFSWVNMTWKRSPPLPSANSRQEMTQSSRQKCGTRHFPRHSLFQLMFPHLLQWILFRSKQSHAVSFRSPLSIWGGFWQSRSEVTPARQTNARRDNREWVTWEMSVVVPPPLRVLIWPFHCVSQGNAILVYKYNILSRWPSDFIQK